MATTFTIVAVFIPVAFMGGMVGQFFYEFGITVAAAVLVSLFVSFTLDPMLSSRWVDPDIEQDRHDTWLGQAARPLQPLVRRPARPVRAHPRLVAAPPEDRPRHRPRRLPGELPHPGHAGRRLHARLQPRRVPGRLQGHAGGDPARDRRAGAGDGAPPQDPEGRRVHLHHDRRGGDDLPAGDRGRHLRQAAAGHGQELQRGAARGPHGHPGRARA